MVINNLKIKALEEVFPLPVTLQHVKEEFEEVSNNGEDKDVLSIMGDLVKEKESLEQLAYTLQYRQDEITTEEMERLMKSLLPFLDGLEHVLKVAREHPPSEEITNWLKTLESLYFRATNILEKHGLQPIEAVGKKVDLDYHEVVEYIPSKESPHNTVIAERQKGYIFKDKVLRDAKVVVSYQEGSV